MNRTPLAALQRLWLHPSKRCGIAFGSASLPVDAAYATARWLVEPLTGGISAMPSPSSGDCSAATAAVHQRFRRFAKTPQSDKAQMQLTLAAFDAVVSELNSHEHAIIGPLLDTVKVLEGAAVAFLERVVAVVPSASECLNDLKRTSVLRMWVYYPGGDGCRPHSDPGLVTAILPGSKPGLSLTLDHLPTRVGRPGDYTHYDDAKNETEKGVRWHTIADMVVQATQVPCHPVSQTCSGLRAATLNEIVVGLHMPCHPILVFGNATLGAVTRHVLPPVVHRVHTPNTAAGCGDATMEVPPRVNIVVELRPAERRRWYGFAPTAEEAHQLRAYVGAVGDGGGAERL